MTSKGLVSKSKIDAIKSAIRAKGAGSSSMTLDQMASAIGTIGGGSSPSGTISITENGTYDVAQYASAVVNVSSGSSAEQIEAVGITVWHERVTAGENSVDRIPACINYIVGLMSRTPSQVCFIRRDDSASPTKQNNEFGALVGMWNLGSPPTSGSACYRFRSGAWASTTVNDSFDGKITEGSVYEIIACAFTALS